MEMFKKRQKEMRRLERQRDIAAKRQEVNARQAAGITRDSDRDGEATPNAVASQPIGRSRLRRSAIARKGNSWRSGISALTKGRTPACIGSTCALRDT